MKDNKKKNKFSDLRNKSQKITSDVEGSYTGVPEDKNERPIQDADDL